jgi:hypothetical protein
MNLNFKLWLEYKEHNKRINKMLMKRLGFKPNSVDNSAIKIRNLEKSRLLQAISQLGMDEEKADQLKNWVKNNPDGTIQNLVDQMSDKDIPDPKDTEDMDLPGEPAELPQGTPQPPKSTGMGQPVQMGSNADFAPGMPGMGQL